MDIEAFIRQYLALFKNGSIDLDKLTQILSINLCSMANIERTPEIDTLIANILTGYQMDEITDDIVLGYFRDIYTGNIANIDYVPGGMVPEEDLGDSYGGDSYGGGGGGGSGGSGGSGSTSNKTVNDITVSIDPDKLMSATSMYNEIVNDVAGIELVVPESVASYTEPINTAIQTGKDEISNHLSDLRKSLVEILNITAETDECIKDMDLNNLTFENISQVIYNRNQNSDLVEAPAWFFKQKEGCTIEGDVATFKMGDKTCTYNLKNHMFSVDGNRAFEAYFYLPMNSLSDKKYSKLNTYTCFVGKDYKNDLLNLSDKEVSNSAVIKIMKFAGDNKYDIYEETALATKLMNSLAGTETGCKNTIAGDSVYGAHSLKIAASTGNTYQSVYCINNAVIVTGENGLENWKTQFSSLDELKGLDGKDIYFISASGDENFNRGKGSNHNWSKTVKYEDGFVYTGIKILCENCPNARVHMVYNEAGAGNREQSLIPLLRDLGTTYSNYSYEAINWTDFGQESYKTHTSGQKIVSEAAAAAATNINSYTSIL